MPTDRALTRAFEAVMRTADAERIAGQIHAAIRRRPDRLSLARAFEDAGIQRDAAERIATEIYEAIRLYRQEP
jgi:hypothetical protein